VTRRDPFAELGLPADAPPAAVKAAWRRLARTHHPDLASDRAEERAATRRMARINAAYEAALRIAEERRRDRSGRGGHARGSTPGGPATGPDDGSGPTADGGRAERGHASGPTRAARPVTRRVDTSAVYRPRGAASAGGGSALPGQPPPPADRPGPEAPRGAPSGPLERHRPRRPPVLRLPDLDAARDHVLPFGKFHDRTLGEVEVVEPTYIDWIVRTIRRDPELVASARVVQQALDDAGVRRTVRVTGRADQPAGDDLD
jgi:hypothetical protein